MDAQRRSEERVMADLSSAFAGCSKAYAEVHLSARTCLDGSLHDGSPCLLTDESRSAEVVALMSAPPVVENGVVMDANGRPIMASERRVAS
jgi:hypothetical protein